ncbi:MAG: GCN5-related N-acetyltransferase [Frankiales bacterium]|nr:GCN5-related N-acetyltransferase [Frankiales bacterium]
MLTVHDAPATDGPPAGLDDLVRACTAHDGHAPFEEHTLLTLDGARQLQHARVLSWDGDRLQACAVLSEGVEGWTVEVGVHPQDRERGVGRHVLRQVVEHVAGHGGGVLRAWVHGQAPAAHALGAAWSARTERRLLVLRRPLDDLPEHRCHDGVLLRRLQVDDDADRDAWLALTNAAFEGHPDQGGWTRSDLDWRLGTAWTDGVRFPVAQDHDGLVAGVWTKVEPGSPVGELHVVAVHPRAHGRRLGRLVVAQALRDLRDAGCTQAELYVEADNVPALRLYGWAGFAAGDEHRCLAVDVPPATG